MRHAQETLKDAKTCVNHRVDKSCVEALGMAVSRPKRGGNLLVVSEENVKSGYSEVCCVNNSLLLRESTGRDDDNLQW